MAWLSHTSGSLKCHPGMHSFVGKAATGELVSGEEEVWECCSGRI